MHDLLAHPCSIQVAKTSTRGSKFVALKMEFQSNVVIGRFLVEFSDLFSIPDSLPPLRSCDHQIALK